MKHQLTALLLLALVGSACGTTPGSAGLPNVTAAVTSVTTSTTTAAPTTTAAVEAGFPVTVIDALGEVTIKARPTAIVSLSPASTEILFAVGAGDQVLAVDSLSNYPVDAPLDPDLSAWTPNVEAIIGMGPDLVIISGDSGDLVAGLGAAGIPVVTHVAPTTIDGVYEQISQVGIVTGNAEAATALVESMKSEIEVIKSGLPTFDDPPSYYHELDDTLYSVTSATFIGQVYAELGLVNIADPADADGSAYGYPQLSAEYLVDADPDFIFLADTICCAATAQTVGERPGWGTLSAVQNARIVELDDDVASRWGPRIVDLLRTVAAAMSASRVSNG